MALFSIHDLTHWEAWKDLPVIWEHKYYLPSGGNCFVLCNSTVAICSIVFNDVKQVFIDMPWTLQFCFCGVSHEWISSVFEVFFFFWFVVMFLLSSWDDIDARFKLLADDVWAAEDDKTGFLSVGVESFDQIYLKKLPISLTMI